ncbi:MAG TPA: hypothetical protein VM818_02065 [Vicinamibacterales bacterium]|nr:hypothetical protein [Vicinamibacterales bacterium]
MLDETANDIVVAYGLCVQVMRKAATDDALAAFYSEAHGAASRTLFGSPLDTPPSVDLVSSPGGRRDAPSDGKQSLSGELEALTVAVENLTLWTIGLTMLVGALAVVAIMRLS